MLANALRLIAGMVAGAVLSLSAPAASLAHGHAHEHLVEHAEAHGALATELGVPEVHASERHDDHAHVTIDPGIWSRCISNASPIAPAAPCAFVLSSVSITREPDAPRPNESPPDPHDTTPAQPRAPPVLLTI